MIIKCVLVALVYTLGNMDNRMFGANHWNWPISLAAVVGLVCGDLKTGVLMGVELQMIFLGFVSIGVATLPDAAAGTTLAVAFTILSGMDTTTAIALAMPIALLFQPLYPLISPLVDVIDAKAFACAQKGDGKGVEIWLHLGNLLFSVSEFILMLAILLAGSQVVEPIINAIPPIVNSILGKTYQVLPALGIAYLMSYVADGFTMPFVILGFTLAVFLGMNSLGVSLIGGIIAFVYYNLASRKVK